MKTAYRYKQANLFNGKQEVNEYNTKFLVKNVVAQKMFGVI